MLRITRDNLGDLGVWRCAGKLHHGAGVRALVEAVTAHPTPSIVLDLAAVSGIDAAGLGALVSLCNWARERGLALTIANPSPEVRSLMELTNLDVVIPVADCTIPAAAFAVIHAA
jgi:anti-sigma B factor antagonist